MKTIFASVILIHGLIHFMGFAKAFGYGNITQLAKEVSKPAGAFWFLTALLFIIAAILFLFKKEWWPVIGIAAVILSQILIITAWKDAKFGTIANVVILVAAIIGYGTFAFSNKYKKEVMALLVQAPFTQDTLLTETDIKDLPGPVIKYLHYTGAVGKPKVKNFKLGFSGQIRKDAQSDWMPFTSKQYNFIDAVTRLFFMNATMKQLPVAAFHCFKNGTAFMDIRLFSLFKVEYQAGKEMNVAETVTFFNDMCCMAPATLIDKRIKWIESEDNKVKAEFTNNNIAISAWLYFNEKGELINFVSDDRYAVAENGKMKKLRWSTPIKDYKEFDGHQLAGYADTIYSYPEGDFTYGNFRLISIEYNCKDFK